MELIIHVSDEGEILCVLRCDRKYAARLSLKSCYLRYCNINTYVVPLN